MNSRQDRAIVAPGRTSVMRSLKNFRNAIVDRYFRSRGGEEARRLVQALRTSGTHRICVTVAFNAPWVLDILTRSFELVSTGMTLIVVDNSSSEEARSQNQAICRARAVPYVGLPRNPEWNPNRSHGISMNWAYYNIVRQLEPELFGFIDHDCFPLIPIDLVERLSKVDAYGLRLPSSESGDGWFLWAGYCFYRYGATRDRHIDFKHRVEFGMDTGGGNWPDFYRRLEPDRLRAAAVGSIEVSIDGKVAGYTLLDGAMFHVGGASYSDAYARESHRRRLSDHIWNTYFGGTGARIIQNM